ncbi:ABC transporter ATP-binding protein [Pseudoneobacillus rhizosphaerae]|uniref:Oligopeptide transport ATP-binding protein OppD n=1 Tax=Pseudoneobacillus rhizosphaerae TaxID=2880968 RepID=A0A9C7G6W8_9BACI|nr:ABC transporter ATP-binding protein [Pseudoneobacillus rhizosphaerae]CAG9607069.1 Oligopeptide transport ATP-binding protein OppD [Pseudoneobacillus rhizosphaerae]
MSTTTTKTKTDTIVSVENLKTYFYTEDGTVPAIDGVSFEVKRGETLAIVGESGSGKSVTSLSIMRLIPQPPGKIVNGDIKFNGESLLIKTEKEMRSIRGNRISMIFQEPMTSLNPVYKIGDQISESIIIHQKKSKKEALAEAINLLNLVGIPEPERRINQYPHELSGGMRQRVMIAIALACQPELLIADEPTTALDVTIQNQILQLMKTLKQKINMSIMLITHDLGVVAEMADNVVVMYAGQVVEQGDVYTIFENPKHPYTEGLLKSMPSAEKRIGKLYAIEGVVPNPLNLPSGCRFAARCEYATALCYDEMPDIQKIGNEEAVRCWKYTHRWEGK